MSTGGNSFGEEVATQVGLFLSVVTGFIVAQGWNNALMEHSTLYKCRENEAWFPWVYAAVATIIALALMTLWGYFIAGRLYTPLQQQQVQVALQKLAAKQG